MAARGFWALHGNLRNLGMDALGVVNLRSTPGHNALPKARRKGLVRHADLSMSRSHRSSKAAKSATSSACKAANPALRTNDALVDRLACDGLADVPFFPPAGSAHCAPRPWRSRAHGRFAAGPSSCRSLDPRPSATRTRSVRRPPNRFEAAREPESKFLNAQVMGWDSPLRGGRPTGPLVS
jgi:hypothetical protein